MIFRLNCKQQPPELFPALMSSKRNPQFLLVNNFQSLSGNLRLLVTYIIPERQAWPDPTCEGESRGRELSQIQCAEKCNVAHIAWLDPTHRNKPCGIDRMARSNAHE
jgi:hypothetical protein